MIRRWLALYFAALVCIMSHKSHGQDKASDKTSPADEPGAVAPAVGYEGVASELRQIIAREMVEKNLPAFSIALVADGRVVWAEGFGHQDAEKKRPATARTVYRVGSVSKLFTDVAVMQLVEKGQLKLDAPVTEYLPEFQPRNPFGAKITLDQLMSHRSGLVRESPVGNYFDPTEPTLAATVKSLNDTTLVYAPGTRTKYSNAGIAVVGQAVERVAKTDFSRWIDEQILRPLEMRQSGFALTAEIKRDLATAWMWTYDGRRFEAPTFALGTAPAGNLYSSVLDLSKFLIEVLDDGAGKRKGSDWRMLKPETLAAMMAPKSADAKDARRFGIGFSVSELDGNTVVGHGGAVYGFSTQLSAIAKYKVGVVAVSSLDGSNGVVRKITDHALRRLVRRQVITSPIKYYGETGPVAADRAAKVAGRYRDGDKGDRIVELYVRNGHLFMRQGDFRYELRALADRFVVDDALAYGPEVRPTESGALLVDKTRYERIDDAGLKGRPEEIPERWKGLIGEYGWDHNTLYILEDHGRLHALIEWFYDYPLREIGENEFAFPDAGVEDRGLYHGEKLIFKRDTMGRATAVVAADVTFKRREVGTRDGETFRIKPLRPIDELRAAALAAKPPEEKGPFRKVELVEPAKRDPTIHLDIRYASTNNFTGAKFYQQSRAFMQKPAAEAVVRANARLKEYGYGILIHDAYRPWHVTKMFWDATPEAMRQFVANPANGSRHNRGCAVDLTLYDLRSGEPITMVSGYDEFSPRAFPDYPGGTSRQRWHRELLRKTMESEGFSVYEFEWWHFDYGAWREYPIGNQTFEELGAK